MTGPGSCANDDTAFFARYQQMRQRGTGLNEDLEQPALTRVLPAVSGRDMLEIRCGDGALAHRLASCGARPVIKRHCGDCDGCERREE